MVERRESCLLCRHFKAVAPAEWKPRYQGHGYDVWEIKRQMRDRNGKQERGRCVLNPKEVEVWTSHYCGQFAPMDLALVSLQDFLWGTHWERRAVEAEEEVVKLKAKLKVARERSQSRLKRLQVLSNGGGHAVEEGVEPQDDKREHSA